MESRTQKTNCLYLELVTSFSSIQKASIDISFEGSLIPHRLSFSSVPILSDPRLMSTIPYGVGSSHDIMLMPVTSPPLAWLRRGLPQE